MGSKYNRKDYYYSLAKSEGYSSRAAYKLIELDKRHRLFRVGHRVIDLGCWPGAWLEVAAARVGKQGLVLGIDRQELSSTAFPTGAKVQTLVGDLRDQASRDKLLSLAGGRVDLVLSDMSPSLSGLRFRDSFESAELVRVAFEFAQSSLRNGACFVAKVFPGEDAEELFGELKPSFGSLSRVHLKSSRKTSSELYFVGKGYRLASSLIDVGEKNSLQEVSN